MKFSVSCRKARELYFTGRDVALDELKRMKLERHLAGCPDCAAFVREADASLALLRELPEMAPSEEFEWNVKRRILQEKARIIRRPEGTRFGERAWAARFAFGAAAAVIAVGAFVVFDLDRGREPSVKSVAVREAAAPVAAPVYGSAAVTDVAAPSFGMTRTASRSLFMNTASSSLTRNSPFSLVPDSRDDSLILENALLKRQLAELERQVAELRAALYRERLEHARQSTP
jgi:anti-sigma-K factor RskA